MCLDDVDRVVPQRGEDRGVSIDHVAGGDHGDIPVIGQRGVLSIIKAGERRVDRDVSFGKVYVEIEYVDDGICHNII
jgi:hypothetical protein